MNSKDLLAAIFIAAIMLIWLWGALPSLRAG